MSDKKEKNEEKSLSPDHLKLSDVLKHKNWTTFIDEVNYKTKNSPKYPRFSKYLSKKPSELDFTKYQNNEPLPSYKYETPNTGAAKTFTLSKNQNFKSSKSVKFKDLDQNHELASQGKEENITEVLNQPSSKTSSQKKSIEEDENFEISPIAPQNRIKVRDND